MNTNQSKPSTTVSTVVIIISFLKALGRICFKIFACALILTCLAHFVPELRGSIPSVFQFADFLLALADKLVSIFFRWFL
ncbi:MAG: hypothetical protein HFJ28_06915 [Clostridia bacterium]|jgi:hypothetical protein|nr:hypothetical protein [Clostridia bacterium]